MKRIVSILLLIVTVFGLASCGTINRKSAVSVLWSDMSDTYTAAVADALDRAMYIKNVNYTHYDAEKSSSKQISQAEAAIANGAAAIVLNAVDLDTANTILTLAEEAYMPIIFLATDEKNVPKDFERYYRSAVVNVDPDTLYTTLGEKVAEDLFADYESYDKNGDGCITYACFGYSELAIDTANAKLVELYNGLKEKDKEKKFPLGVPEIKQDKTDYKIINSKYVDVSIDAIFAGYNKDLNDPTKAPVELILTDDDSYVCDVVLALRNYGYNDKNLVTHCIPVYTVGNFENASVLAYGPEAEDEELNHKNEKTRKERQATRDAYTVMSAIDSGYIAAAVLEDDDALALSTATILRNLIKKEKMFSGISSDYVSGQSVLVPYTIYGN